jgi:hypothetical protein
MEELINLNLSENTIGSMIELNPYIKDISGAEIKEKEILLEKVGCRDNQIRNIISSNSLYLSRSNEDIIKLVKFLSENGFDTLNILFDSNPYILNLDVFEIENYINNRIQNGEEKEDIIDDLDSNPYLFNEI